MQPIPEIYAAEVIFMRKYFFTSENEFTQIQGFVVQADAQCGRPSSHFDLRLTYTIS